MDTPAGYLTDTRTDALSRPRITSDTQVGNREHNGTQYQLMEHNGEHNILTQMQVFKYIH